MNDPEVDLQSPQYREPVKGQRAFEVLRRIDAYRSEISTLLDRDRPAKRRSRHLGKDALDVADELGIKAMILFPDLDDALSHVEALIDWHSCPRTNAELVIRSIMEIWQNTRALLRLNKPVHDLESVSGWNDERLIGELKRIAGLLRYARSYRKSVLKEIMT